MKQIILLLTIIFIVNIQLLSQESLLIFSYDNAGNLINEFPHCPFCCPNNVLLDSDFENSLEQWKINNATISSDSNGGDQALQICSEQEPSTGTALQKAIGWTGITYTLNVYAKSIDNTKGQLSLTFLDGQSKEIGEKLIANISTDYYFQYTLEGLAPDSTRFVEVKAISEVDGCIIVDDWCLTSNIFQSDGDCQENRLSNAAFYTDDFTSWWHTLNSEIDNFNAQNCSYEGGGIGQTIPAEEKERYTLKMTAKVSQKDFDAFVGMEFMDIDGNRIGNVFNQLVYNTNFQEFTLSALAPEDTYSLKVWFKKGEGEGCLVTRDWCLTSTADFIPPPENTLMLYAYRDEYVSRLLWTDETITYDKYFFIDRLDADTSFQTFLEVSEAEEISDLFYKAKDEDPNQGSNIYRVRMALEDNYFMTSNLAQLKFPKAEKDFILVPNPAKTETTIIFADVLPTSEFNSISIYDALGKQYSEVQLNQQQLADPYFLPINDLKGGMYFIVLRQDDNNPITKKLMVAED